MHQICAADGSTLSQLHFWGIHKSWGGDGDSELGILYYSIYFFLLKFKKLKNINKFRG
jgi:hypothetical protein